jgi:hypothetical protein
LVTSNLAKAHHLGGATLVSAAFFTLLGIVAVSWFANRFYDLPIRTYMTNRFVRSAFRSPGGNLDGLQQKAPP